MSCLKMLMMFFLLHPILTCAEPCVSKTSVCDPKLQTAFKNMQKLLSEQNLPFDHLPDHQEVYSGNTKYSGISYYVPTENARYEKLEGYEDIYVISNDYDPNKHPMNRGFLGTSAVIKVDRSKNPFAFIYLSKEILSTYGKKKEFPFKNNVNEHLCSLNQSCFQKLELFKKASLSSEFDQKIVLQYKSQIKRFFQDRYLVDTYRDEPEILKQIEKVLSAIDSNPAKSINEVNQFIQTEMNQITEKKLQGRTRDQYPDRLEYVSYSSISSNTKEYVESFSLRMKKDAILEYCASDTSEPCKNVRLLKDDLDFFQARRKPITLREYLPES